MDTNSLKPIKLLVQKGVPLPPTSLHTVLQSILSDPAALSAAPADIFEFVSTILALCQQLDLHKNSDLLCCLNMVCRALTPASDIVCIRDGTLSAPVGNARHIRI